MVFDYFVFLTFSFAISLSVYKKLEVRFLVSLILISTTFEDSGDVIAELLLT